MKLTKNADLDQYGRNSYGTGFNAPLQFSLPNSKWGKNFVVFGIDNGLFVHSHNRKIYILVLGESPTDRLDNATITPEVKYSINITKSIKKVFKLYVLIMPCTHFRVNPHSGNYRMWIHSEMRT